MEAPSHELLTQYCSRRHGPKTSVAKGLELEEYQETEPQHGDRSISSYFKSKQNLVGYEHNVQLRYAGSWCTWSRLTTLHILHQGQCSCYLWLHLIIKFKEDASFKSKKLNLISAVRAVSGGEHLFESLCNNCAFYLLICLVYSQTITQTAKIYIINCTLKLYISDVLQRTTWYCSQSRHLATIFQADYFSFSGKKHRKYEKICPQCRTVGYLFQCGNSSTANT